MIFLPQTAVSDLIVFVLVFSVVYGILAKSRFFYKSDIPALIAVAVGLLTVMSQLFVQFMIVFLPYILSLVVVIFALILLLSTAMVPQESIFGYMKKSSVVPILLIFMVFIFGLMAYGVASSSIVGQTPVPSTQVIHTSSSTGGQAVVSRISFSDISSQYIISIFTAPSVLSLIMTLGAIGVGIFFMTRDDTRS